MTLLEIKHRPATKHNICWSCWVTSKTSICCVLVLESVWRFTCRRFLSVSTHIIWVSPVQSVKNQTKWTLCFRFSVFIFLFTHLDWTPDLADDRASLALACSCTSRHTCDEKRVHSAHIQENSTSCWTLDYLFLLDIIWTCGTLSCRNAPG